MQLVLDGKCAGECYEPDGWAKLKDEPTDKTEGRVGRTMLGEHQTPQEHVNITMELEEIPKILAMILNNEKQYATSEKSARYTNIVNSPGLTESQKDLYNQWFVIIQKLITKKYGDVFDPNKIKKLAQENARYFISVFVPTQMIHTVPLAQLNRIAGWLGDLAGCIEKNQMPPEELVFFNKMYSSIVLFLGELSRLNLLYEDLQSNRKQRAISLFAERTLENYHVADSFGDDVYVTSYWGSFAQFAQAHRHRTLWYEMVKPIVGETSQFYVPPIIADAGLTRQWLNDMYLVKDDFPQGMMVKINEKGPIDAFILKCKERLCSAAQLEIMQQTTKTLSMMQAAGVKKVQDIPVKARCQFKDYTCPTPCGFAEGINLTRII